MRLLAFLDESGSFELADGHVDGMGLLVVPEQPQVLRAIRVQVQWLEEIARPEERIRGKVKGSHLRLERFPPLLQFLEDHGIQFSPLIGGQRRKGGTGSNLMLVASRVASVAKSMAREARGIQIAMSLLEIQKSPRFYCAFAYHLIRSGILADLPSHDAPHVELVYDRRLSDALVSPAGGAIGSVCPSADGLGPLPANSRSPTRRFGVASRALPLDLRPVREAWGSRVSNAGLRPGRR